MLIAALGIWDPLYSNIFHPGMFRDGVFDFEQCWARPALRMEVPDDDLRVASGWHHGLRCAGDSDLWWVLRPSTPGQGIITPRVNPREDTQSDSLEIQRRCLDMVDEMELHHFLGLDEELRTLDR